MIIETKADVAKAMESLLQQPQTIEKIQAEIQAVYKAAALGATREQRRDSMNSAITDLATRAILSDLMLSMLTNGLPDGGALGEKAMIQVQQ